MKYNYLTGKENIKIRELKKLLTSKKERRQSGLFCIDGDNGARELLKNGFEIVSVFITEKATETHKDLTSELQKKAKWFYVIDERLCNYISGTPAPQGIFVVSKITYKEHSDPQKVLILENIQDCGNLGTLIRTSVSLGFDQVYAVNCCEMFSPKTLRSSAFSVFCGGIKENASITETTENLKNKGFTVYAAALDSDSKPVTEIKFNNKAAAMIGNEGNGLTNQAIDCADCKIIIPMKNNCDSLNAAVSGGILMWEIIKNAGF